MTEQLSLTSMLTWEIAWTDEPGGLYSSWGRKRVGHNLAIKQQQQHLYHPFLRIPILWDLNKVY